MAIYLTNFLLALTVNLYILNLC